MNFIELIMLDLLYGYILDLHQRLMLMIMIWNQFKIVVTQYFSMVN